MPKLLRTWIVCAGVLCASVALAQPKADKPAKGEKAGKGEKPAKPAKVDPKEKHKQAVELEKGAQYEQALAAIEEALPAAKDKGVKGKLLGLKGAVLVKLRDYDKALPVYEAYLAALPAGPNAARREAQKIVENLRAARSTSLEITLANGPADVYLDAKEQGVFCRPEPACTRPILPGEYQVIAERAGAEPWTGKVTVAKGQVGKLAITLPDPPSLITITTKPAGARITVGGAVYTEPALLPAGRHEVIVSLAGHADGKLEAVAAGGKPISLDVSLVPLVPIRVEPATAELSLDGKPIQVQDGRLAVPRGTHDLVARAPGFQDREIEIPAERPADFKLEVKLAPVTTAADEPKPRSGSRFTLRRKLSLVVGGVGLAAVGAGVLLGVRAGNVEDTADPLDAELTRRSRRLQSNLSYGAAGLAIPIAIALWIDGAPGPIGQVAITPRLDSMRGLEVAVRF